jgi:carbamoyltransferase
MATVLGISAFYHDAAAALVMDGVVVAAMQEERFSRIKHDPSLPKAAAQACISYAKIRPEQLDAVVYYEQPFQKLERILVSTLRGFPRSLRQFPRAIRSQLAEKLWVLDSISEMLNVPRQRVHAVSHHQAHAASAFLVSPYERAAVLTLDGVGEDTTTAIWSGDGDKLSLVAKTRWPQSLGLFYAAMTAWAGFEVLDGECKLMGLAAWGTPRYRELVERVLVLDAEGGYELKLDFFDRFNDAELGFGAGLERLLGPRRTPHKPWDLTGKEDQRYADVAATVQLMTEEAILGLARRARRETGARDLCLAGGVALNAVANARLAKESGFERIFVQPAAGDAGGALGAAILGAMALGDPRPSSLKNTALGLHASAADVIAVGRHLGLTAQRVSEPTQTAATLLSQGKLIAFVQDRFEFGPRALGQRSLLATPETAAMRDRLNSAVKRREPFRPFAPALLSDCCGRYFDIEPNDMTKFMTTVASARATSPTAIEAVVHRDGTARLQTVTADSAPALDAVLRARVALGDAPIVLNTSLNGRGEPIVGSATDALQFFVSHAVDALIVEDVLVEKPA